jgi:hypothetical protein
MSWWITIRSIYNAKAVEEWLRKHPRVMLLFLPTYAQMLAGPRGRRRRAFHVNGPWPYKLSDLYDDPAVTAAVERMAMENTLAAAV